MASRRWTALGLGVGALLPAAVLVVLGPGAVRAARRPGADLSDLLGGMAVGLGLLVAARLALVALTVLVAQAPGAVGRAAARVAEAVTPAALRSLVRVAVGATVAVAPVAGWGAAGASAAFTAPADPGGFPVLDRAVSTAGPVPGAGYPGAGSAAPTPPGMAAPPGVVPPTSVVVRPGDTLWTIAARHLPGHPSDAEIARAWPRWYAANRAVIGGDPALLRPGQVLEVPR